MRVKAVQDLRVPIEHDPRRYIDSTKSVEVDITPYYLRRLAAGELVEDLEPLQAAKPKRVPTDKDRP